MVKVVTKEFSRQYHEQFPYVNQQMAKAVKLIGSLWFSAWVEAGQPYFGNGPDSFNEQLIDISKNDSVKISPMVRAHEH